MNSILNDASQDPPKVSGYYWVKHPAIKAGRPCVARVEIDEFTRLSLHVPGEEREYTGEELPGATWSWRIHPPLSMIGLSSGDVQFLDDLPF